MHYHVQCVEKVIATVLTCCKRDLTGAGACPTEKRSDFYISSRLVREQSRSSSEFFDVPLKCICYREKPMLLADEVPNNNSQCP